MILLLRKELIEGDFANNMKLLQNFPEKIDVSTVIRTAKKLANRPSWWNWIMPRNIKYQYDCFLLLFEME